MHVPRVVQKGFRTLITRGVMLQVPVTVELTAPAVEANKGAPGVKNAKMDATVVITAPVELAAAVSSYLLSYGTTNIYIHAVHSHP